MNNKPSKEQIINQAIQFHLKGNIPEATKYYQHLISQGCNDHRIFSNYGAILKDHILTCTGYTSEYADTNINVAAVSGTTITLNSAVTIANGVTLTFKTNKYYKAVNEGTYFVSSGTFNSTTGELTSTSSVISSTLSVGGTSKLTGALTTVAGITNTGGEILVSGGNVQLNDSISLTLGTGDDTTVNHDGSNFLIQNSTDGGNITLDNQDADKKIIMLSLIHISEPTRPY